MEYLPVIAGSLLASIVLAPILCRSVWNAVLQARSIRETLHAIAAQPSSLPRKQDGGAGMRRFAGKGPSSFPRKARRIAKPALPASHAA